MEAAVPAVEVADDPHGPGVGRPHRERRAGDALVLADVGAEQLPQLVVAALADQVEVELAERRPEPVRVVDRDGRPAGVARPRAGSRVGSVVDRATSASNTPASWTCAMSIALAVAQHDGASTSRRAGSARTTAPVDRRVGAEHVVRIAVLAGHDRWLESRSRSTGRSGGRLRLEGDSFRGHQTVLAASLGQPARRRLSGMSTQSGRWARS